MKKISSLVLLTGILAIGIASPSFAADQKEVTITGQGQCAKCALHETDKCQNTIQTKENGKTVTYYLAQNKVSKDFHDNICEEPHKITATGKITVEKGKKILTPTKIEMAK